MAYDEGIDTYRDQRAEERLDRERDEGKVPVWQTKTVSLRATVEEVPATTYGGIAGGISHTKAKEREQMRAQAAEDHMKQAQAPGAPYMPTEEEKQGLRHRLDEALRPYRVQAQTEYDRIRMLPTSIRSEDCMGVRGVHESTLRAYQILDKVKRLLADGVPCHTVCELIEHMESKP